MFKPKTDYDFRITANDKSSHITFMITEYIHQQLSSLSCTIEVLDNKFSGWSTDVWFSISDLLSFFDALEELEKTRQGKVSLSTMSTEDFNIQLESYNKKGDIVVFYSIKNSKLNSEISIINTLNGGFQIDSEYLPKLVRDFKKFISVSELKTDIYFN